MPVKVIMKESSLLFYLLFDQKLFFPSLSIIFNIIFRYSKNKGNTLILHTLFITILIN